MVNNTFKYAIISLIYIINFFGFSSISKYDEWKVDFFDDFETFDYNNWQDQRIWVNNEKQCYVPDNEYNTREVSNGTLKIRLINIEDDIVCDNVDKYGNQHPETTYVAGRIASKNRIEFIKGKWTARLRIQGESQASMFPAWWILGAQNNEPQCKSQRKYLLALNWIRRDRHIRTPWRLWRWTLHYRCNKKSRRM